MKGASSCVGSSGSSLNSRSRCSGRRREPLDTVAACEGSFSLHSFEAAEENQLSVMVTLGRRGQVQSKDPRLEATEGKAVVRGEWSNVSSGVWQSLSALSVRVNITGRLKKKQSGGSIPGYYNRSLRSVWGVAVSVRWCWGEGGFQQCLCLDLRGNASDVSQRPEAVGLF